MRFASICSGIGAPEVAWHSLGWQQAFSAEIEPFPSAVLAHHFPGTPNLGDFTKIGNDHGAIDLLVGGTPCQDFSVAGLRAGLAGDRGQLTIEFLKLAGRLRPRWVVWENVPGILSDDEGRSFGVFLGELGKLGYGFAYRVLDAQFFGVAQRRRRVFVVGCLGDWRRAAAVLFERDCLSGNPPPSREKGKGTTHELAPCIGASGRGFERAGETRGQDPVVTVASTGDISHCLNAGGMGRQDYETETLIAHAFSAKDHGADAMEDCSPTLRAAVMPAIAIRTANTGANGHGVAEEVAHTLDQAQGQCVCEARSVAIRGRDGIPSAFPLRADDGSGNRQVVQSSMAVRRLTPRECERLQGFPDNFTAIEYRGKPAADGPRYKALGNSMAVPVMARIGERIEMVESP